MASCVPPDTAGLAFLNLDRLRTSEVYRTLPANLLSILEPLQSVTQVLVAYNDKDLLIIGSGNFSTPPPGAVLLTARLVLGGSPAAIRAATQQHRSGRPGAETLWKRKPAGNEPIWAVLRGDAHLPLTGNGANLNRLLHFTTFTTVRAEFNPGIHIAMRGEGATADSARQLEESLRAMVSLARATSKAPDTADMLDSVQIQRENAEVKVDLQTTAKLLEGLFR
ncbi:MAG: hypothetical protein JO323_09250 [Acidobacteriia bacterium]|nr:hypothetical protein [Terriglobia bacterium]